MQFRDPHTSANAVASGHAAASESRRLRRSIAGRWKTIAIVLALIALAALVYGYVSTRSELTKLKNPKTANQTQTQSLVSEVGKLVQLPTGETPTVATVNDASKLKNQEFFAHAQNGDKVLVYTKANRAVLYRPSAHLVIEYASVNTNGTTGQ